MAKGMRLAAGVAGMVLLLAAGCAQQSQSQVVALQEENSALKAEMNDLNLQLAAATRAAAAAQKELTDYKNRASGTGSANTEMELEIARKALQTAERQAQSAQQRNDAIQRQSQKIRELQQEAQQAKTQAARLQEKVADLQRKLFEQEQQKQARGKK